MKTRYEEKFDWRQIDLLIITCPLPSPSLSPPLFFHFTDFGMPDLQDVTVSILVDDTPLPEYKFERSGDKVDCYIASETGKVSHRLAAQLAHYEVYLCAEFQDISQG